MPLTQRAAVLLLPGQVPLRAGAEEQEGVVVRGILQLAKKMGQSGKLKEWVGKWTRRRAK